MAKYTIELRNVCNLYGREEIENWFKDYELTDYLTSEQIDVINNAGLWNKDKLATQIVDAYFMREIGFETPFLFKHYAKCKMRGIMETKLLLIYSNSLAYDPLINVNYSETFERSIDRQKDNNGSSNATNSTNANGLTVNSDTPQGQINKSDILNGSYASTTSAGESTSNSNDNITTQNNEVSNDTEKSTKTIKGNSGISVTSQKLIEQYRNIIIGINGEIIQELNSLFMGIY